jgi:hypothetical protein
MADRSAVATSRRANAVEPTSRARTGPMRLGTRDRPLAPVRRRAFRLPEVVLGVLLVAGSAMAAGLWQQSTNSTITVVVASHAIARGTVIGPADLRGAQVGGETGAMIGGGSAATLLGKIAVVDIGADVPLSMTLVADSAGLGADEALTSMALAPGHLPPDLAPNDRVRIVTTGQPDPTGSSATTLVDEPAVVWAVDDGQDGVTTIVTLRASLTVATTVAGAAEVRLVRVEGD